MAKSRRGLPRVGDPAAAEPVGGPVIDNLVRAAIRAWVTEALQPARVGRTRAALVAWLESMTDQELSDRLRTLINPLIESG